MSPAATPLQALEPLRADPVRSAVLLDIDGTLAPIVRHASDAHVPEATRTLLIEIAKRYGLVACISGRRSVSARQIVAIGSISYIGNHGGELLRSGSTRVEVLPALAAWTDRIRAFADANVDRECQRLRIRSEDKGAIVALHWRGAPDEEAAAALVRQIAARAEQEDFAVHWGRKVLEVRPPVELNKGIGIAQLLHETREEGPGVSCAVYVGDDLTDLDAFRGLRELVQGGELESAVCVAVSSEEAPAELTQAADFSVCGQSGVRSLLRALL
ncbi:MAG: trehalose-phosphatase [Solirubrobacteraceae bacterium]